MITIKYIQNLHYKIYKSFCRTLKGYVGQVGNLPPDEKAHLFQEKVR